MSSIAAVLKGAKDLQITSRECPAPLPDQVTIRIKSTSLCGSDLHYYLHGRNGNFQLQAPLVLGHEGSGQITAIGSAVSSFQVGDNVAIEAGQYCGSCRLCKRGRYNLCPNLRFASSAKTFPHLDGTLQTAMNFPAKFLHKMKENITYEQASLVEPLSVVKSFIPDTSLSLRPAQCLQARSRSRLVAGQTVLILGAGAIGLLMCAVAKASGATRICVVDIDPGRVGFAETEGFATAGKVLERTPRRESKQDALQDSVVVSKTILDELAVGEDGFDVVYECSGVESCIQMAIFTARPGGIVCLVGMGTPDVFLPLGAAALREVDIVGVFRYANTYAEALAMIETGRLPNIDKLVTHRFPLKSTNEAFEMLAKGKGNDGSLVIKIMVGDY